jgi:hypothetical protein
MSLFLARISATLKADLRKAPAGNRNNCIPVFSGQSKFSSFGINPKTLPNPAKKCVGTKVQAMRV